MATDPTVTFTLKNPDGETFLFRHHDSIDSIDIEDDLNRTLLPHLLGWRGLKDQDSNLVSYDPDDRLGSLERLPIAIKQEMIAQLAYENMPPDMIVRSGTVKRVVDTLLRLLRLGRKWRRSCPSS